MKIVTENQQAKFRAKERIEELWANIRSSQFQQNTTRKQIDVLTEEFREREARIDGWKMEIEKLQTLL